MKSLINYFLFFTPSFLNKPIRRLLGQKIGKKVRLGFGSLIAVTDLEIGDHVKIGSFSVIRGNSVKIGSYSKLQSLSILSTRKVVLGKHTHIAPLAIIKGEQSKKSSFILGDHSRVFPFCWIDTGHGVEIGKNVGIGGHTLIFTHGVWPNYLDGAQVSFGKVIIHDNVWIPWRVFILPNTEIGENSIIGGNSLLNKSYPANSLIGGSPAKVIKENIQQAISNDERRKRFDEIIVDYMDYNDLDLTGNKTNHYALKGITLAIDCETNLESGDILVILNNAALIENISEFKQKGIHVLNHINKQFIPAFRDKQVKDLVFYLRRYGVRLYTIEL